MIYNGEYVSDSSYHGLAINILIDKGKPLRVKEILKEIKKSKRLEGKTPTNTLRTVLIRSKHCKRIGYATYGLIEDPKSKE